MSFVTPTPSAAGFAAAQENLRTKFGRDIRFYAPAAMIYDPAIPPSAFDDEGIPLDPLAGASATASANVGLANLTITASAQALVVFRTLQTSLLRRDQTAETPLGTRAGLNKDLIMAPADGPKVARATYFMVGTMARDASGAVIYPEQWTPEDGELWKIVAAKADSFGPTERFVVYGQGTR